MGVEKRSFNLEGLSRDAFRYVLSVSSSLQTPSQPAMLAAKHKMAVSSSVASSSGEFAVCRHQLSPTLIIP